jgi:diguanylate cyclase
LTIPLDLGHGQPQGLISLDRPRDRRYPDRATIRALELFADQCAAAIARAQLHNQMEQLASTDPRTGLHNRRALASTIASDLARAGRSGQPYSILFCDLDHFKQLNDRWGHAIGDQMLQQVAATLRQRVRRGDFVARYGGDEFVVLLPDTTLAAACVVAEELRERVGADATSRPITISIGAAAAEPGDEDWAELVAAADAAMYLAKQQGRNRVQSQRNLPANAGAGSRRLTG